MRVNLGNKNFFLTTLLVLAWMGAIPSGEWVKAAPVYTASLRGEVRDKATRNPVVGAMISSPGFSFVAVTDSNGNFIVNDISLSEWALPITLTISASGFSDWTIKDVLLIAGDTLILTPLLEDTPVLDVIPRRQIDIPPSPLPSPYPLYPPSPPDNPALPPSSPVDFLLPDFIRVRVTGDPDCNTTITYTVETVNFKFYAKHVLPSEWIALWPRESLRAGALAVKMYAWYWISRGGKWNDADVYDSTCDQVYNPNYAYESTNQAVDYTWYWLMTRNNQLFESHHMNDCDPPECLSQTGSAQMAHEGHTWDEIVYYYYTGSLLSPLVTLPAGFNLRFDGTFGDEVDENRILIPVNAPSTTLPGPPVDVGASDFTIEWWMKSIAIENAAPPATCGINQNWVYGNIILDRDRQAGDRTYGVSLGGGKIVFGVCGPGNGYLTLCGVSPVADNIWHHIAVQRRLTDGQMMVFVDGNLEVTGDGPDGDISYPDDITPTLATDPYLSLGAWKLADTQQLHPFYRGWLDELRFSNALRYTEPFTPTEQVFTTDLNTVALYHFDEGIGATVNDTSEAVGGPSHGTRYFGGTYNGPEWMPSDLFLEISQLFFPVLY